MTSRRARLYGAAVAAVLLAGAVPAAAGAADYCVAPNKSCNGGNLASLELALDFADQLPDSDRILLGAATYKAPTVDGYVYDKVDSPVEIVGQGTGKTILTAQAGAKLVLGLEAAAGSSLHDLTVRLPENAAQNSRALVTRNAARRIAVVEDPTQSHGRTGVEFHYGGTLEDSTVTLDPASGTTAAVSQHGMTMRRSVLEAKSVVVNTSNATIEHSRLTGMSAVTTYGGTLELNGSLVRFEQCGICATSGYFGTTVNADGVTLAGAGVAGSTGASLVTEGAWPQERVSVALANSVIRGADVALKADAGKGGKATITASYSDFKPSTVATGAGASIAKANVSHVDDAGFVDPAAADYRLRPDSPLLDAGDPAAAQGLDLDGNPLVADGNGDGTARRDLGAFERQFVPAGGEQPAPAQPVPAEPTSTQPDPAQPGAGEPGATPPPDTQAPVIGALRATRSVFAIARGTRFRYTLSEPARVTLKIRRARRGGGYRTVAGLVRSGATGANSIRVRGRIGRRALRPGRYRAVVTATDAAGNRSIPRAVRFRIAAG